MLKKKILGRCRGEGGAELAVTDTGPIIGLIIITITAFATTITMVLVIITMVLAITMVSVITMVSITTTIDHSFDLDSLVEGVVAMLV